MFLSPLPIIIICFAFILFILKDYYSSVEVTDSSVTILKIKGTHLFLLILIRSLNDQNLNLFFIYLKLIITVLKAFSGIQTNLSLD